MPIDFTIGTSLTNDQTAGVQTPTDGDDANVTLMGGELDGLDSGFGAFLAGLGLSSAQKDFAVLVDAADSTASFIQISGTAAETMNDIKLIGSSTTATGWTTLTGDPLYLHVDSSGNYATLTTAQDSSGRIVAAFALTDEVINNTTHAASAGVQFVTFEAISHGDTTSNDETLALGDVLRVAVDTAMSFNFSQLDAGNFLWAAVGNASSAMLITGQDLDVKDSGSPSQIGNLVTGGGDPSDTVNTSKASDTTIGINAQHFAPTNSGDGATAVFTFVSGFKPLDSATPTYTGGNVKQIDYDGYLNVSSASISLSQVTGSGSTRMLISLFEAGGGGVSGGDKAPANLLPEEGYSAPGVTNLYSYIGNQDTDSNLRDDTAVDVATVTIRGFTWTAGQPSNGTAQGGITVTIDGNDITVIGAQKNDTILFTAVDGASSVDGTFNRVDITALSGSASFDIGHIDLTQGGTTSAGLGSHLFVDDDGPTLSPQAIPADNDLQVANIIGASDSSSYTPNAGTDGLKSFGFINPDSDGLFKWAYYDWDGNGTANTYEIKGTYDGKDLYKMILQPNGTYTLTMIGLLPGSTLDLNPAEVIKAGSPDTPTLEIGAKQNDDYVQMTGGGGNINESHGFVGVTNGNIDVGESIQFKLFDGDDNLLTFQGIQIGTKSAQGGQYSWTAHVVGGGTISSATNEIVGKNGVIDISSADLGGATIDSITIMKVSGSAIKIGVSDIHIVVQPDDAQIDFTVALKDGDNDAVTQSFVVDFDADNDGNFDASVSSLAAPLSAKSVSTVDDSGMAPHLFATYDHGAEFMQRDYLVM